ncbi:DUF4270 domain-containing protein [Nonlabens ulvanivorans]|uniref:DUF4270 domain-containing protein n=1 Tax=Nonlabens ulvanivorans TaxID=906888 RepID=UPI002943EE41|nr:DUF4270 domain-containing protein [Nonlabens ulvanivorans]WOI22236.1 DUF4270 domain-containing protein [Nonlabens ulvanivorans]
MKKKMMSKMKRVAMNVSIVAGIVLGLAACDNELNTIGSDILGADQLNDRIKKQEFDAVAFNDLLGPVQTNNFGSFPFGVYDDPVYGRTSYDFVSQVNLAFTDPDFGDNIVLDSVVLQIPYYSTVETIIGEVTTYSVDSLYGTMENGLEIYENKYFLNSFDVDDVTNPAVYYSDFKPTIESNLGPLIYSDDNFFPKEEESIELTLDGEVSSRSAPRLRERIDLTPASSAYWRSLIIDQEGQPALQSASDFQNYFRGLYFKLSGFTGNGHMVHFNLNDADIKLYIRSEFDDDSDIDNDPTTTTIEIESIVELNFDGNKVGFINNELDPSIVSNIQAANNDVDGEERLYLKGGEGSMVLIDLFGPDVDMNGEADALTQIIADNWIINDASLTFYVDQAAVEAGSTEPERIILYNYDDKTVLIDYVLDNSSLRSNHLGVLERVDDEDDTSQGVQYKIRLTEHINSIISGDIENVRLGLAVTQNISSISGSKVKNPIIVDEILNGSAISHEGTVLHGNLSSDADKRLKLEIYYSETIN